MPLVGRRVGPGLAGKVVDVLVEDRLEPPVDAIARDPAPIGAFVRARAAWASVQAIEKQHRVGPREETPQAGREDCRRAPVAQLGYLVVCFPQPLERAPRDIPRRS